MPIAPQCPLCLEPQDACDSLGMCEMSAPSTAIKKVSKRFATIMAIYTPHSDHIETLRKELLHLEGERAEFFYAWKMDDDDAFPGVWALTTEDKRWLGYWVPEFDLENIQPTLCRLGV